MNDLDEFNPRDLTLRHTDKKGNRWVTTHRVWNAMRFLTACINNAAKEGGKSNVELVKGDENAQV